MGLTTMTALLGFTLAALNAERLRSYRPKHHLDEQGQSTQRPKQTRAKWRTTTWALLIDTPSTRPPPT